MKGSANLFPHIFLLLQGSVMAAAEASSMRIYWRDGSMRAIDEFGTEVTVGPQAAIGSGVESFTDLDDVPNDYATHGLKVVRVNSGATALEFWEVPLYTYDSSTSTGIEGLVPPADGFTLAHSFLRYDGLWRTIHFKDLVDAPSNYAGFAGALVDVNDNEDGVTFVPLSGSIEQNAKVEVRVNSAGSTHRRHRLNFIEGTNVTIGVSDDSTDDEVDITISATASGSTPAHTNMRTNSTAYEASKVIKNSSGNLKMVYGYNSGPAQFIQLHDASSLPADGVAPASLISVDSSKSFSISLDDGDGIPFANGIVVCNSTTGPTKTVGGSNCYFTGIYD